MEGREGGREGAVVVEGMTRVPGICLQVHSFNLDVSRRADEEQILICNSKIKLCALNSAQIET